MGLRHRSYKKKFLKVHINKNVKPTRRSLHRSRRPGNCPTCRNEQLRTSRRYVYVNSLYTRYAYRVDTP